MTAKTIRRYRADFEGFSADGFPSIPKGTKQIDFEYYDHPEKLNSRIYFKSAGSEGLGQGPRRYARDVLEQFEAELQRRFPGSLKEK